MARPPPPSGAWGPLGGPGYGGWGGGPMGVPHGGSYRAVNEACIAVEVRVRFAHVVPIGSTRSQKNDMLTDPDGFLPPVTTRMSP